MKQNNDNTSASAVPGTLARHQRGYAPYDLLSEKEVSATLGVATGTLRNWRSLRAGPDYVKLGQRTVRYRWADVAAFIDTGATRMEVRA